jgi:hypothetical protein
MMPLLIYLLIKLAYDSTVDIPWDAGIIFISLVLACITIIDTIILTNYTNDAYIFDTHTPIPNPIPTQCSSPWCSS